MPRTLISLTILVVCGFCGLSGVAGHAGNPLPGGNLMQQILSKEREELDSLKVGNMELFADLLGDEAVFVDARGPASKDEVVKNTSEFRLQEYSMENVRFVPVSDNTGLIVYKLTEKGTSHGKDFAAQVHVSALWTERGGKWVCIFSQETAAK